MKIICIIVAFVLGAVATSAGAILPFAPTKEEIAVLPPFCAARIGGAPGYEQWVERLGRDFDHTHHYCYALNFLNRYNRTNSPQDKRHYLNEAETNFSYMVTHARADYVLMPEIYINRAKMYRLRNDIGKAVADLSKAIELSPNSSRGYVVLADTYDDLKQPQRALEVVTQGLRHDPNSKSLQRRYAEHGGKMPYPEPYAAAVPGPGPASSGPAPAVPVNPGTSRETSTPPSAEPRVVEAQPPLRK